MNIEPELNPPWVYEPQEDEPRFDATQIEYWLGAKDKENGSYIEAVEIITAIANEEYSVKHLIQDLEETFGD
jgi:Zn-dependent M32 family carboxypeptidase